MYVENILRRIVDEKFVQFLDNKLVFRDGVIDLAQAPGSSSLIPRAAYASAIDGTGFTLTNDDSLDYVAWAVLPADATPLKEDFTGLWYRRKGLPGIDAGGTPGTNGEPGGFRMNMSTLIAAEKPGTGKIRFNHTDISQATEMYIDEMIPSGVDLSGTWSILELGWYFILKPATNFNSPFAVIKVTGDIVDNDDWFTLPIEALSVSNETFPDGEKLVLQFFGGGGGSGSVTEAAIRAAGNFPLLVPNGAGGYKIIDNANLEIKSVAQVFKLPGFTITGVEDIPEASTFDHGAVVRLHQDVLVGAGANPMGIEVQADAINNIWRPHGDQILFWKNFGTLASPTLTLTAAGVFDLGAGGNPVIPAGLLYVGTKLTFYMKWKKVGTTTPTMRIWFGTDMSAHEENSFIYTQSSQASADSHVPGRSCSTALCITNRTYLFFRGIFWPAHRTGRGGKHSWMPARMRMILWVDWMRQNHSLLRDKIKK